MVGNCALNVEEWTIKCIWAKIFVRNLSLSHSELVNNPCKVMLNSIGMLKDLSPTSIPPRGWDLSIKKLRQDLLDHKHVRRPPPYWCRGIEAGHTTGLDSKPNWYYERSKRQAMQMQFPHRSSPASYTESFLKLLKLALQHRSDSAVPDGRLYWNPAVPQHWPSITSFEKCRSLDKESHEPWRESQRAHQLCLSHLCQHIRMWSKLILTPVTICFVRDRACSTRRTRYPPSRATRPQQSEKRMSTVL